MRRLLGGFTALVLAALYAPIGVMVLFSFNESKYSVRWTGFTLDWYRRLAGDTTLHHELGNTLLLAGTTTVLATVLGTMAALAARDGFRGKRLYSTLIALPVMVPDIVLAIALRALFDAVHWKLSLATAVVAHTTFNLSYVAVVVSARLQGLDRSIELAGQDLGASPLRAFWKVTLPAILPGVVSGAVLAFTLSFDDFVITYFTTSPGDGTLPMRIYSMVRFAVTPEINALSTVILVASLALIAAALRISRVPVAGGGR
ncbi:MAG TPA: ABC transporter permease [Planctomycetota bacterium]|jgi:spermidine/putrescine transport system permease protein|nr:ABC transporter permease [Planctomycetota bacterium]